MRKIILSLKLQAPTKSYKYVYKILCIDGSGNQARSSFLPKKTRLGPLFFFFFCPFGDLGWVRFVIWVGLQMCWAGFMLICVVDVGRFELRLGLC